MDEVIKAASPPSQRAGRRRAASGILVAIAVLAGILVVNRLTREDGEMGDVTASGSRDELDRVLVDTAARLGLEMDPEPAREVPVTCSRPGGGSGESYFLQGLYGPTIDDVDGALAAVRAMWEDLGYQVSDRAIEPARGLSATTTDGGSIYILTGPGGTVIAGESACTSPAADGAGEA